MTPLRRETQVWGEDTGGNARCIYTVCSVDHVTINGRDALNLRGRTSADRLLHSHVTV